MARSFDEIGQAEWQGRVTRLRPQSCPGAVSQSKGGSRNRPWVRKGRRWEQTSRWVTHFDAHALWLNGVHWAASPRSQRRDDSDPMLSLDSILSLTILRRAFFSAGNTICFSFQFLFPFLPINQQPLSAVVVFIGKHNKAAMINAMRCVGFLCCGLRSKQSDVCGSWREITRDAELCVGSGRPRLGLVGL